MQCILPTENTITKAIRSLQNDHNFRCPPLFAACTTLSCGGRIASETDGRYPSWCVRMECVKCPKRWSVCKFCAPRGIQTSRLASKKAQIEHNKLHSIIAKEEADILENKNKRKAIVLEEEKTDATKKDRKTTVVDLTEYLDNPVQLTYLKHDQLKEGKKYLAALQMTQDQNESPTMISELDADLNILIASLVLRVTKGERLLISKIFSRVVEKIIRDQQKIQKQYYTPIPVPSSENEFRRYFDGRCAILNNVPIPKVNVLANGDAFVLPSDFLRLYFSMGLVMPSMVKTIDDINYSANGISEVWQSKKAKECLNKLSIQDSSCYKILLCEWSDGFDPNNNKSSRGSIHVTTFSMFSDSNRNDKNLSFVSTICSDKSNKNEIRRHVYNDLKELRKPTIMFDGTKFIKVSKHPYTSLLFVFNSTNHFLP